MTNNILPASFRDPAGFMFEHNQQLYRQINKFGKADYHALMDGELYKELTDGSLLIKHQEVGNNDLSPDSINCYKIIKPARVPFISYPYEWSFSELKDAALATLAIARQALVHDVTLKDASAFNIQFVNGKPILIDTLSFETYVQGKPWVAYRQFCQHFLAPLSLMAYTDIRLAQLWRGFIDGIPLDLAVKLLPAKAKARPGLFMHLVMHARAQAKQSNGQAAAKQGKRQLSKRNLLAMLDNLQQTIVKLKWQPKGTEWGEYYTFTNYSSKAFKQKRQLVTDIVRGLKVNTLWDLGGNTGEFCRPLETYVKHMVCFDIDPAAIEKNYNMVKQNAETKMLPLLMDLTNPTTSLGWAGRERDSLTTRGPADVVLALALVHHLAISNNVPLPKVASYLSELGHHAIVEFVPKTDSKVKLLLSSREDIFDQYHEEGFEAAMQLYFTIVRKQPITGSKRSLYLLKRKQ